MCADPTSGTAVTGLAGHAVGDLERAEPPVLGRVVGVAVQADVRSMRALQSEILGDHESFFSHCLPELHSSGTRLWRGHWYTEQSLVFMLRSAPPQLRLSREANFIDVTQRTASNLSLSPYNYENFQDPLTTDSGGYPAEAGIRLTFGNIIGRDDQNRAHDVW